MATWDSTRAKAQFRLTAQRLGQLRDRKDAQGRLISKDISILLQQGNETLARAKAQRLIQDEIMGNLLENLEMQIGVVLERFSELDSGSLSPLVVEAASTIIFAAPQIDSKDLLACGELLGIRLGPHFIQAASSNRDRCVSAQVVRALSAPPASAADMHAYLAGIARSYSVQWTPEYRPSDVLSAISEILDKSNDTAAVDMSRLSKLCTFGIPDSPAWLRPRIWRLLLGTLPVLKASWDSEAQTYRENYYDLVRRLLEPFSNLPPPTSPPSSLDAALTGAIKDLFRVPANLFSSLEEEPETFSGCPLDPQADSDIRISSAANLDIRLGQINQSNHDPQNLPEIRLDGADSTPVISVTSPDAGDSATPRTLLYSQSFNTGGAHPKHASALIRLLYIHSCLNPANHSPHMASLLIPVYSVLLQEVESLDVAHVEADTFWLFEAIVGEFSQLEDEEGGNQWMRRLSERLEWADPELSADLRLKGLDPGLPHYSYRWLAPILTHTLPLPSVLSVWDSLFVCPMTTRDSSPKLDALLDVCASMLIRLRGPLFRLGKTGRRSPSLWAEENSLMGPPSPVRAWELNDAFIEGMSLLQMYPLEAAGGIDSVLQTAVEFRRRREEESKAAKTSDALGSRLRDTFWRGFTNQGTSPLPSPDISDSSEEEPKSQNETETLPVDAASSTPSLTSRLASVVWQGITNQSAMDVPPSPISPAPSSSPSPLPPSSPVSPALRSPASPLPPVSPLSPVSESSSTTSSIWGYAEKIRDSDTAASLAKVSTNWRVRAMQAWNNRQSASPSPNPSSSKDSRGTELESTGSAQEANRRERSISDTLRTEAYSPPARPAYFRPPRDSMLPQPRRGLLSSPTSPESGDDTASTKMNNIRDSIASLTGLATTTPSKPSPKSAPRPLLLNSSSLLTRTTQASVRSPPTHLRADSSSSTGFPAYATSRPIRSHDSPSEWESDTTESRIVPLNRRSVSPMAPQSRMSHGRLQSSSSEKGVTGRDLFLNGGSYSPSTRSDGSANRGWSRIDVLDSPATLPPSPPLHTPPPPSATLNSSAVSGAVYQRGSVIIPEPDIRVLEAPSQARKPVRKITPPPPDYTSDSSAPPVAPPRSPRLRSRRSPHHLAKLHVPKPVPLEVSTSPNRLALPELSDDHDSVVTPRATAFRESSGENSVSSASPKSPAPGTHRARKLSSDGRKANGANGDSFEPRPRKFSSSSHSPRTRKVSETRPAKETESAAEEGDDEGYDELLNAYESEDSSMQHH
ncbi:regulator of Vps4 activity in the MVB pathway-domain-containing protein [Lactarius pseudohatsudake]|nr:regulator of Vps4 activity in the MVB pathway-domain-containing protein [Lactarius pseudohatsudake]